MTEILQLGEVEIVVTRKTVKNVHLSVHPPAGHVTLVTPTNTRLEVARAYAISKLGWIREQQATLRAQARETPRQYIERESHDLWGRRSSCSRSSSRMENPRSGNRSPPHRVKRAAGQRLGEARGNHAPMAAVALACGRAGTDPEMGNEAQRAGRRLLPPTHEDPVGWLQPPCWNIRLNTELVKKPKDLLEYVVVHEMLHLIEPTHGERFVALLDRHYPTWREALVE